jgi:xanthine dehydrogenase accessory factor
LKLFQPQSSHFLSLIEFYLASDRQEPWVLALLIDKQGSSYRQVGAAMLVNSSGQYFGLISGGCLESDIVLRAKKVLQNQRPDYAVYDMADEDSEARQLGGGCQGKIGVLIIELNAVHDQLFERIIEQERLGEASALYCYFAKQRGAIEAGIQIQTAESAAAHRALENQHQAEIVINPRPRLWICGGGVDARPLARLASALGWVVSVIDHRAAYANPQHFSAHISTHKATPDQFCKNTNRYPDAAVIISHQLATDSQWLEQLYPTDTVYIGLLGPAARKNKVIELLSNQSVKHWAQEQVYGPAGLFLGGEGPEAVALSIIAQCQQVLQQATSPNQTQAKGSTKLPTQAVDDTHAVLKGGAR